MSSVVFVTVADGFVGITVSNALAFWGFKVRGTARSVTQPTRISDRVCLHPVESIEPVTYWAEFLDGVDFIVHLAAKVHVMKKGANDQIEDFRRVNSAGTKCLALNGADN